MPSSSSAPDGRSSFIRPSASARFIIILLLASLVIGSTGCKSLFGVKQTVNVPPLLGPLATADATQLMEEVNRVANVRSIRGKVDIQFQDTSFAESGLAEKYRTADGTLYLQRPGQIYLKIQAPFVGTNIAEMTSDGEHFRVAVLQGDEKYRRFVKGTNNAIYPPLTTDDASTQSGRNRKAMTEQHARSVLANLRPQHLTDALLIRPIQSRTDSGLVYAQSEFYQEEADTQRATARGRSPGRVVRGYYFLDELSPGGPSGARLLRRFWFDRVGTIKLMRLQTFDQNGMLITDVLYTEPRAFAEGSTISMPSRIEITRPQDRYKLSIAYQAPEAVILNHEYPADVFVLENKSQLPEYDLDARQKQSRQ